ncbi:transposase [Methylobacterium sp. 4-46]|uniref:IS701 family transposase n=1 Tax=unclassified Methylobacterium TaxID=2615210 RepID=UPI000152D90B|nr:MULTISPECIES: IS701 family transposase [Methylobacterium]ACA18381.1 transposase [Methylobacterium sp. 4-46]WFT77672.1 IS701 family transposase [Methylobacterium nodulans]
MDPLNTVLAGQPRFGAYVGTLSDVLGHADRIAPLKAYCTGLLLPGTRKSIAPMAAQIAPARVQATHQVLHHFVANGEWSDAALLARVRAVVLPVIESRGPIQAWIVEDTGFPRKGRHSVGVGRQSCGQVGKQDDCQVAVTLSLANGQASLPIAYRLYLPEAWAHDAQRRMKAGVPQEIGFQTKPEIALDQIRAARAERVPPGLVLADAGYGSDAAFRTALTALGLRYSLGIAASTGLWPPGTAPLPPEPWSGRGRPPTRMRRSPDHEPLSAETLARALPDAAWQEVRWRAGTNGLSASRFAAVRVRPAHRDEQRRGPGPEEWVLIEWPDGEDAPTQYWISTLPAETSLAELVSRTKLRWRIERDYTELKQEIGLGHYEGRGWRGFHHHASLCIAAYGFLVCERGRFSPAGPELARLHTPDRPAGDRSRGTPDPARASWA